MNSFFTRLSAFKRRFTEFSPRPERDWHRLLSVAATLLLLIVAWHVYVFRTALDGGSFGGASKVAPASEAPSALETLPAFLNARAAEDEKYVVGSYSFADPSQ